MSNHAPILLRSGQQGLAKLMRRFLSTQSATIYDIVGHVFQNRYKSIVCDAASYFTELARYIHLNPLRVKLVGDLKELERYPYCGHGAILGTIKNLGGSEQFRVLLLRHRRELGHLEIFLDVTNLFHPDQRGRDAGR
jgi:REP-associated tyrosine transposase